MISNINVLTTLSTVPKSHLISHLEFWSFNGLCFHLLVVAEWCLVCFQCASNHHNQLMWKQLEKINFLIFFPWNWNFFSWNWIFFRRKNLKCYFTFTCCCCWNSKEFSWIRFHGGKLITFMYDFFKDCKILNSWQKM